MLCKRVRLSVSHDLKKIGRAPPLYTLNLGLSIIAKACDLKYNLFGDNRLINIVKTLLPNFANIHGGIDQ